MGKQFNVAWPMARIMKSSKNGKKICVGIRYQWSNGEWQNRMDGEKSHPMSELTFIPIPPEELHTKPPHN